MGTLRPVQPIGMLAFFDGCGMMDGVKSASAMRIVERKWKCTVGKSDIRHA
jgi:hypothetical protein